MLLGPQHQGEEVVIFLIYEQASFPLMEKQSEKGRGHVDLDNRKTSTVRVEPLKYPNRNLYAS